MNLEYWYSVVTGQNLSNLRQTGPLQIGNWLV